jgi:hypothetical protein
MKPFGETKMTREQFDNVLAHFLGALSHLDQHPEDKLVFGYSNDQRSCLDFDIYNKERSPEFFKVLETNVGHVVCETTIEGESQ